MMGQSLARYNICKEIEVEENFSEKVEYIEVYEMSGLGVNSASFGGADLSKLYVFGLIDTNPWLSKS